MNFIEQNFYHIYNRGNNRELLFQSRDDYLRFLRIIAEHFSFTCNILSWCLMPNHFHFLVYSDNRSVQIKKSGGLMLQSLTDAIKISLSSYTKYYNRKYNRSGNLFQQKTKAKLIEGAELPLLVFNYIHQNPWKASLVKQIEDWEFSSFKDYLGLRKGELCDKTLGALLLNLSEVKLYEETYNMINNKFEYLIEL